jgi:GTPase SAR1 family protein
MSEQNTKPYILLIGDAGVGKTSYIRRLQNHGFSTEYIPTSGHQDTYIPGLYTFIELSGQEIHNEYAPQVLERADRIFIMVAKNSISSIEHIPFWINKYDYLHVNFTLLINKCDIDGTADVHEPIHSALRNITKHINIHYISCKNNDLHSI